MDKTKAQLTSLIPMADNSPAIDAGQLIQRPPFDCFMDSAQMDEIRSSKLPTYDELPNVPLYRDQVISYITLILKPLDRCSSSEWLTPSMINNYVKMHLVSPPVKKQYGREQISRLLLICILKQFLSISAIEQLFKIQSVVSSPQEAYDHMVAEINHIVDMTFSATDVQSLECALRETGEISREELLVRAAAQAFASKALLMAYLQFAGFENRGVGAR